MKPNIITSISGDIQGSSSSLQQKIKLLSEPILPPINAHYILPSLKPFTSSILHAPTEIDPEAIKRCQGPQKCSSKFSTIDKNR